MCVSVCVIISDFLRKEEREEAREKKAKQRQIGGDKSFRILDVKCNENGGEREREKERERERGKGKGKGSLK